MADSALLLTAHGHAPYLIGAGLLRNVADNICIPAYYGEDQRTILRDKFPDHTGRIFLSESMGALMEPLLLGRKSSSKKNKDSNIDLYAFEVKKNVERIRFALEAMLQEGIDAVSLDGTRKRFSRFDFALNTGLPVYSPVTPVFFAFVSRMSEIYRLSPYQSSGVSFLTQLWKEIESTFSEMFVPRLHSLCHRKTFNAERITFTPPFAQPEPRNHDDSIRSGSTLVVVSGTGMDVRKLIRLVKTSPGPWVTLPESPLKLPHGRVPRKSPRSWGNPNVIAVIARSGMGSIWQAVLNQKPIGVVKPDVKMDPEVFHNARMVEKLGIGKILKKSVDPLVDDLSKYRSSLEEQLNLETKTFGTTDGIEYTCAALERLLLSETAGHK